jgi:hypothetical protein
MVISWGTKNLVLSKGFKDFSLLYRSTIICNKVIFRIKQLARLRKLTGILVGNLFLIAATSSFRSAETKKKRSLENYSLSAHKLNSLTDLHDFAVEIILVLCPQHFVIT